MKSLLTLIVFGAVCVQAVVEFDEALARLVHNHKEVCIKKSHVDPVLLEKARNGDFSDNADFRKHVYCVAQQIGFIDDSGNVVHDVLKTKSTNILKDKADEIIQECLSNSADPTERAVATFKCYYDKGGLVLL